MKSASEIRMDFGRTARKAEQLKHAAGELRRLGGEGAGEIFRTDFFWTGGAADAWSGAGIRLAGEVLEYAEQLDNAAESLRRTAEHIYEAEMRAYRFARSKAEEELQIWH